MGALKMYKVGFVCNKAARSEEVDFISSVSIERELSDGNKIFKSITIFATNKDESLITAQGIADFDKSKGYYEVASFILPL